MKAFLVPISLFHILALLFLPSFLYAEDVKGSRDHPMFSRYEGSRIIAYTQKDYDEYTALLGPSSLSKKYDPVWNDKTDLEGKITRILYQAPKKRSTLEIFKNYETEIQSNNFKVLFECKKEDCGKKFYKMAEPVWKDNGWVRDVFVTDVKDQRYLAAKLTRPDAGDIYVFIYVVEHTFLNTLQGAYVHMDVVEMEAMDTAMVQVDAEAMTNDITNTGHVAVYGIYFDTDKADLKPESKRAIDEIAKMLNDNPDLNVFVVGHTDNQGDAQYNMELSHRRAVAVRDELVSSHGVNIERLGAVGMGFFGPVASNRTEEGRALNRRVELVEF